MSVTTDTASDTMGVTVDTATKKQWVTATDTLQWSPSTMEVDWVENTDEEVEAVIIHEENYTGEEPTGLVEAVVITNPEPDTYCVREAAVRDEETVEILEYFTEARKFHVAVEYAEAVLQAYIFMHNSVFHGSEEVHYMLGMLNCDIPTNKIQNTLELTSPELEMMQRKCRNQLAEAKWTVGSVDFN